MATLWKVDPEIVTSSRPPRIPTFPGSHIRNTFVSPTRGHPTSSLPSRWKGRTKCPVRRPLIGRWRCAQCRASPRNPEFGVAPRSQSLSRFLIPPTCSLQSLCDQSYPTRSTHPRAGGALSRTKKNAHEASTMLFGVALSGRLRDGRCVTRVRSFGGENHACRSGFVERERSPTYQ